MFISKTRKSFKKFRKTFFTTSLFRYLDLNKKIKFKVNALNFVISKIIFLLNEMIKQDNRYTYTLFLYTYTLIFIHIHSCLLN